jgi:hypothetical protein
MVGYRRVAISSEEDPAGLFIAAASLIIDIVIEQRSDGESSG